MNRFFRTFLILPALIAALVVIPTVAFSASQNNGFESPANQTVPGGTSPLPTPTPTTNTVPPLPTATTPGGTIPVPTATRRPPVVVYPTATPVRRFPAATVVATPTAVATTTDEVAGSAFIDNERIKMVIGDRLSSTIYAYTFDSWLYRSDDDGRVWALVSTEPTVDNFVMSAADPDVLYGSDGYDCTDPNAEDVLMYKSVDGGVTWIEVADSLNKQPLLAHQGDVDSLFAADCEMLYVTTDGGFSWTAKPDSSPDALWENFRVIDMVAASLVGDPMPDEPNWNQIFAGGINEDGTGVVAFSNDLGESWVRLTPNIDPAPWSLTAITADPFTEGLLAFTEPRSIWFTENYGVNWQVTTKGLSNVLDRGVTGAAFGLFDIVYHPNDTLYVATARGLYEKSPASTNWSKVEDTDFDLVQIDNMLLTETALEKIWLNTEDGVYIYAVE